MSSAWLPAGPELIVGAVSDPAFGPLVACGAGGLTAELVGDIQVRLAPLGPRAADGMLRGLKTFRLLDGYRGRPRADARLGVRPRHACRCARGRASRRRRARPQPGHRLARGRAGRRRSRPGRRPGARRVVPVTQCLIQPAIASARGSPGAAVKCRSSSASSEKPPAAPGATSRWKLGCCQRRS